MPPSISERVPSFSKSSTVMKLASKTPSEGIFFRQVLRRISVLSLKSGHIRFFSLLWFSNSQQLLSERG